MSKITIWGRKSSVNVQSVLWCLEELGLAYKRIDAGFTYGVVTTPAYMLARSITEAESGINQLVEAVLNLRF